MVKYWRMHGISMSFLFNLLRALIKKNPVDLVVVVLLKLMKNILKERKHKIEEYFIVHFFVWNIWNLGRSQEGS